MKICISCNEQKPFTEFHSDRSKSDGLVSSCKLCKSKYRKKYYSNNREHLTKYSRDWHHQNKELATALAKEKYINNIEKYRERRKAQYWSDPECAKANNRDYARERAKIDPVYRLKLRCRKRIWAALKESGYTKKSKSFEIIGCSIEDLCLHLEKMFTSEMNWENYGKWHVDHIIPLASADSEDDVIKLCHYTNLQPLWADENLRKGARLDYCNHKAPP